MAALNRKISLSERTSQVHSEVIKEIRRLRGKGYTVNDTARMTQTTPEQ